MESIYEQLKEANQELDSHESDLYVLKTEISERITKGQPNRSFFVSQKDGRLWIELPFQYEPFWNKRREDKKMTNKAQHTPTPWKYNPKQPTHGWSITGLNFQGGDSPSD